MYQKCHSLSLLIIFTSFSSGFSTFQEDPFALNLDPTYGHHLREVIDDTAILHATDGQNGKFIPEFSSLIKSKTRHRRRSHVSTSKKTVNVDDFGAKGDGADDSKAFVEAWKEACSSKNVILLVPKHRTYHLKPTTFSGPCNSSQIFKISGTIKASPRISDYEKDRRHWLVLENIQGLIVEGGGIINGNGRKWWKSSCKVNKTLPCKDAPTAVTFYQSNNLEVANLRFRNSQKMHLSFQKCVNVKALNLRITAPRHSPNTDGIHVTETRNITIQNSIISTGDDCISIVSGSENVRAVNITCGPGHGISIGSLGAGKAEAHVSNVMVNNAKLSGTTNGVRIKTWQGGTGYARGIVFQNIMMNNVSNPIIIDQNYCDQADPCSQQTEAVQVSNVVYKNIKGTSASKTAIKLECSKSFPCEKILLDNVKLVGEGGDSAEASCENARFSDRGKVFPLC